MKKKVAVKKAPVKKKKSYAPPAKIENHEVEAFKEEQQLWRKRGRPRAFETAQDLWNAACEYFEWCDNNPMYEHEWKTVGKHLVSVSNPKKRPYMIHGFCIWIGLSAAWWKTFKANCDPKKDVEFFAVIQVIEETIYNQKYEGAASGFFNANIISRDLGLVDKKENTNYNLNLGELPIEFE